MLIAKLIYLGGKDSLFLGGHDIFHTYDAIAYFVSAFLLTMSRPKQLSHLLRRLPSSSLLTISYGVKTRFLSQMLRKRGYFWRQVKPLKVDHKCFGFVAHVNPALIDGESKYGRTVNYLLFQRLKPMNFHFDASPFYPTCLCLLQFRPLNKYM